MYVMNADGTDVRLVRHSRGNDDNPMWSPDGVRIAYSGQDSGPGVYLTTAGGDSSVKLVASTEAGDYIQPAWSPDGTAIAFAGTFEVPSDLFLVNSDGSGLSRLSSDGEDGSPAWQPTR